MTWPTLMTSAADESGVQNGVRTLYSTDRDFRKFESLDVRDPFA